MSKNKLLVKPLLVCLTFTHCDYGNTAREKLALCVCHKITDCLLFAVMFL